MDTVGIIARLQQLMKDANMNAAGFAEYIGVQRSLLSHVLSGRNKPSLDFLVKVEAAFPKIDFEWLLKGAEKVVSPPTPSAHLSLPKTPVEETYYENSENEIEATPNTELATQNKAKQSPSAIIKIVHYFEDGRFEVYHKR